MKPVLLMPTVILFLTVSTSGQFISPHEADSISKGLDKNKPVADRIESLTRLAQYHIGKPGESKTDLDRAAIYINQAKKLSKSTKSPDANGYLLLIESDLIRERGNRAAGKKMAEKAVKTLESGTNKNYLGLAYMQLGRYYLYNDSWVAKGTRQKVVQGVSPLYEIGLRSDSIKLKNKDISLLKKENSLQQANLRQVSLIRNITVIGITFAFITIGLLYRQYRQKQKSAKETLQKNEQLQQLLTEKEWLVKEIHHRVKNNLQMVVSLLNVQTEFLTHPSAIDAIKESRERMQAIAILHQKLYQLDNNTRVNMRSYINELIDNIKNSFADSERIHFNVDVTNVNFDISQSVPLGLILNECITNAIKYAYPKHEKGVIRISLKHQEADEFQLKIADNGKGLTVEMDVKNSNTLGIQLIKLFSEQLEGDLYFINNNGLEITLNFHGAGYHEAAMQKITA